MIAAWTTAPTVRPARAIFAETGSARRRRSAAAAHPTSTRPNARTSAMTTHTTRGSATSATSPGRCSEGTEKIPFAPDMFIAYDLHAHPAEFGWSR